MTERESPGSSADLAGASNPAETDSAKANRNGSSSAIARDERPRDRSAGEKADVSLDSEPTVEGVPLAIETSGLRKHFGETKAVDGIGLSVPAGGIYGLLGPNGAGKTTTIRMLATLLRPDDGSARVLGHDVASDADAVRSRVSLTGQFASVDEDLTGTENLHHCDG